jgi:di/tricarboxylate transporter
MYICVCIGGGLSISVAIKDSGLGEAIGLFLQSPYFQKLSKEAFLVVILVVVSLLTIIASNTATASILTPVMIELVYSNTFSFFY